MPAQGPFLSVVVPTLNREQVLCETLRYFFERETYERFEVIVVDQSRAHEPETERYLSANADRMRYFRASFQSLTKARNFGVERALGEIIVFVDDDVEPHSGFLQAHADAYRDETVAGVTGPTLAPGARARGRGDIGEALWHELTTQRTACFDVDFPYDALWAPGCNMSFRRAAIERVGGFDENFYGVALGEDAEFAHRLRASGGRIRYEPGAGLIHKIAKSGGCRSTSEEARAMYALIDNTNYFYSRIGSSRWSRGQIMWRLYRAEALNRASMVQGRWARKSAWFVRGLFSSELRLHRIAGARK